MALEIGLKGRADTVVTDKNTALAAGSGALNVFATPFMLSLMERAAWDSLEKTLEPGKSSVGTRVDVSHSAATPVGMRVYAESEVIAIDGRKVTFRVTAYDEAGEIGSGEHERMIIDCARFMARAASKLEEKMPSENA